METGAPGAPGVPGLYRATKHLLIVQHAGLLLRVALRCIRAPNANDPLIKDCN